MGNHAYAVIGANFGDEGKGLAVDAISSRLAEVGALPLVVRSNGGAQAGHGVQVPNGPRHVFHHVGSGSFVGAPTHLSQFFVVHPMFLAQELEELHIKGAPTPRISIDPRAEVTTPWDVFINQSIETVRAGNRHGSCGLGFGESLERRSRGFSLRAADLKASDLHDRLVHIRDTWAQSRLEELSIDAHPDVTPVKEILWSDAVMDRFLEEVVAFNQTVTLLDDAEIGHQQVLFEGAQGLMLDMTLGVMPHLTRSNTGLRNMVAIAQEAEIDRISPTYMTRSYMTRHGAGPLRHEQDISNWADVVDETNAPNTWQGNMRFAPLDVMETGSFIARDIAQVAEIGIKIDPRVGVTCIDQLKGTGILMAGEKRLDVTQDDVPEVVGDILRLKVGLQSRGPDRGSVRFSATFWEKNMEARHAQALGELPPPEILNHVLTHPGMCCHMMDLQRPCYACV